MGETYSKLTGKTAKRCQCRSSSVFIVNFKQEDFTHCSGVSIVDFEQVNNGWVFLK